MNVLILTSKTTISNKGITLEEATSPTMGDLVKANGAVPQRVNGEVVVVVVVVVTVVNITAVGAKVVRVSGEVVVKVSGDVRTRHRHNQPLPPVRNLCRL